MSRLIYVAAAATNIMNILIHSPWMLEIVSLDLLIYKPIKYFNTPK